MHVSRVIVSSTVALVCLGVFSVCQADQANQQDSAMKKEMTPLEQQSLKLVAVANEFRMLAASDINGAVLSLASPGFHTAWKKEFEPYFQEQEMQWHDFFSSALIFGGRFQGNRAVALFYNPWSDIVFLAGLDVEAKSLLEGFLLCGEVLRGDPVDENAVIPAWQREASSLPVALAKVYTRTEQAINKFYPLEGSYELIPQPLLARLGPQSKELLPAKLRMALRMEMFAAVLNPEKNAQARDALASIRRLTKAITSGDKPGFSALVSPSQDKGAAANILDLPADVRGRMAPNFFLIGKEGGVAALVNPVVPQWFIPIYLVRGADGKTAVSSVELFRFSLLNLLLK